MKKTLLIAAAALAASLISSQAQVYSQNIVGYVNVTVPTNGYALVGNQLDVGDGTNGISTVFSSGLISDVNDVNNTEILTWNYSVQAFQTLYYFNAADAATDWGGTSAGWYDNNGTFYNTPVPPGVAAFLLNYQNTHSNLTVTLVGTVPQATNIYTIKPGLNFIGLTDPVVTNLCGTLANFTGYSDVNDVNNDQILVWQTSVQAFQTLYYFNAADAATDWGGTAAGFYDNNGTYYPLALPVGSGFFINHVVAGNETWTNSFSF